MGEENYKQAIAFINQFPNIALILFIIALLVFIVVAIAIIYRIFTDDEVILFKGNFISKGKNKITKLEADFSKLNCDSKIKGNVIKFTKDFNKEICNLMDTINQRDEYFEKKLEMIYNAILLALVSVLKLCQEDINRTIIFIPDGEVNPVELKVYKGLGISLEAHNNLRLAINRTIAGRAFVNSLPEVCGDVSNSPFFTVNPRSSAEYSSLICAPIIINGRTVGVLSVDATSKDAFNRDSILYLEAFAGIIAKLMTVEKLKRWSNNLNREVALNEQV